MQNRPETVPVLTTALLGAVWFTTPARAQDPVPGPPPAAPPPAPTGGSSLVTACEDGGCCPPTTGQKVLIGVGDLAILLVTFFLFVGLMERRFINTDRSSQLGRHLGMSLSLFLTAIGVGALAYLVTGCWPPEFTLWVLFAGAIWAIHGIYTLIVVRGS